MSLPVRTWTHRPRLSRIRVPADRPFDWKRDLDDAPHEFLVLSVRAPEQSARGGTVVLRANERMLFQADLDPLREATSRILRVGPPSAVNVERESARSLYALRDALRAATDAWREFMRAATLIPFQKHVFDPDQHAVQIHWERGGADDRREGPALLDVAWLQRV